MNLFHRSLAPVACDAPGGTVVFGQTAVIDAGSVIVFDPKGDVELLRRMFAASRRAGRLEHFYIFHLGFPEISARYNPVGEFGRITEVASRIATQLPSEGNSAAFREFAWRFTNAVARAMVGLGRKPDYTSIARYVTHIEPLLIEYHQQWFGREAPKDWAQSVKTLADNVNEKSLPTPLRGRDPGAIALIRYAKENGSSIRWRMRCARPSSTTRPTSTN